MAKDQNRLVELMTVEDMNIVFNEVIDNVVEHMMDRNGSILVEKLLEFCKDDQRLEIVLKLTKEPDQLVRTSSDMHGRVVQKLISTLKSRREIALVRSAILSSFLDLVKDPYGNHIIQECLSCWSVQDTEFIFDAARKFCLNVATDRYGSYVIQYCIEFSKGKRQENLLKEICNHGFHLAQDKYGHYVIEYIIKRQNPSAIADLTAQFKGNYVLLSVHKFSCYVVEKFLECIVETRATIVEELLSVPHFEYLLQEPCAKYVLKCALRFTQGSLHESLVDASPYCRGDKTLCTRPYCRL